MRVEDLEALIAAFRAAQADLDRLAAERKIRRVAVAMAKRATGTSDAEALDEIQAILEER